MISYSVYQCLGYCNPFNLVRMLPGSLNLNITIKTSTLDLQERERSEFLLTVLYLDYEDLYCYCIGFAFIRMIGFLAVVLNGCELRLVTGSQMVWPTRVPCARD